MIMIGSSQSKHEAHRGEDIHLATAMDPWSKVDYSHITPEAGMMIKKASSGDSPLRQGAGKSVWTLPISRQRRRWLAVCFLENWSDLRIFSSRRIYRQKGGVRRWARWPHHLVARARGRPRHPMVRLPSGPPPSLLWTPSRVRKIGTSTFVSSNSENITHITFLKHKNSRKQGTCTVASR
jgi:hypothetical protein